ncbi:phage portal protein [Aeromonas veronii]|uniref:phage portal protein n=1 Tax=Aeromonas veronii TaxID=654 RepID=UPI00123C1743|nr:phage portal protein [Aeromonas veronii]QET79817.1 phage portal protein [Aeromonas veronii]
MFFPFLFERRGGGGNFSQWISSVGARRSKAGVMVTPESALAQGTVRACVTLLAESIAQLPCELYQRSDDSRTRASDHPLYDIIHASPNQKDTSFEFNEQRMGHLGLRGNAYSLIERSGDGYITELIPVNPDKVRVLKGPDGLPYYQMLDGSNQILPMRMVHHVKGFSLDGYIGSSPIQSNPDAIGLAMAVDEHAGNVFSQGTTLSGVIEGPNKHFETQDKLNAFRDGFSNVYSGMRNAFKVAILQEGMQYKQMAMTNEQSQLLESRKYGAIEICRLYKIPPHMIGELDRATNNNIEHQGLQFVIYTLLPWVKRIEAAMMRDLLLPSERKDLYIEFNLSGLLRADQKSRYESYALGRQWGWLSVNDIRRLENLPPITGGDIYLTPLNMVSTGKLPQGISQVTDEKFKEIEAILCRS